MLVRHGAGAGMLLLEEEEEVLARLEELLSQKGLAGKASALLRRTREKGVEWLQSALMARFKTSITLSFKGCHGPGLMLERAKEVDAPVKKMAPPVLKPRNYATSSLGNAGAGATITKEGDQVSKKISEAFTSAAASAFNSMAFALGFAKNTPGGRRGSSSGKPDPTTARPKADGPKPRQEAKTDVPKPRQEAKTDAADNESEEPPNRPPTNEETPAAKGNDGAPPPVIPLRNYTPPRNGDEEKHPDVPMALVVEEHAQPSRPVERRRSMGGTGLAAFMTSASKLWKKSPPKAP